MALAAGTRVGSYEVVAAIGAGGMGEVYQARDTELNRDVASAPTLTIGKPRMLFEAPYERDRGSGSANPNYDVTRDGQPFVMIQVPGFSSHLGVVVNWFEELKARMASGRK